MSRQRLLFLIDFDETLTRTGNDTTSRLANAAYSLRSPAIKVPPWSYFADNYIHHYEQHAQLHPPATRPTFEAEKEFLKSLKPMERLTIELVETSGIFKGLDFPSFLRTAAGDRQQLEALMRKGWWVAMRKVLERGEVAVVSINWSRRWIRECLEGSVRFEEGEVAKVRRIEVYANELAVKADGRTTTGYFDRWFGPEDGGIWTGWDKLRIMKRIIHDSESHDSGSDSSGDEGDPPLVIYVGDSTTDFLCLMEADVGIVFGKRLDNVCQRLGVEIQEGLGRGTKNMRSRGKGLFRIENWDEVTQWIDTV